MNFQRNHGSEPGWTRLGTGYYMTRKKPFRSGEDIVQSGRFRVCARTAFWSESCSIVKRIMVFTSEAERNIIRDLKREQEINSRVQVDQDNSKIMFDNIDILNDDSLTLVEISPWAKEQQLQLCNHDQWNRKFSVESDGIKIYMMMNVKFEPNSVNIIAMEFNGVDIMPRKTCKPDLVEIPEP